jgi:pyruvate carboxylase subunit A
MFRLGYESVGTVEFLVDDDDNFFFMEMNTRIQVEHTITEIISGIDLLQRMIEIAAGDKLLYLQEEIGFRGYAIEFRINAEDASRDFAPHPGKITKFILPGGPGVRVDTAAFTDYEIPPYYDSMIGKLIVWALDWEGAVKKARRALDEFVVVGVPTNIPLHKQIIKDEDFISAHLKTDFLDKKLDTFNLEAVDATAHEDEKMEEINLLIETIEKNSINVH